MCILCDKEINGGLICNNCLDYLPVANPPLCSACGRPIAKSNICKTCRKGSTIDHGRSWLLFIPPSDQLIHHFKYQSKMVLSQLLGRAMASIILSDHILAQSDGIASVPLHWWKKLRRGYDQAALLARVIGQETGIKQLPLLRRVRNTRTQTHLTEIEREKNVRNAFAVNRIDIRNKRVLLIDDVLTTGATINECARALKENGAAAVYSCVAAITPDKK
jgi:competence protein ComFC